MKFIGLLLLITYVGASPLLGSKKCTWGPSYWCSHISHAKECGAVKHCVSTVWKNQKIEVKSDETCTYCMLLVGELRSALENKGTEDEIAKAIADACSLLPAGIDRTVCEGIVEDDLPEVMQILLSKITPSMACHAVGFCSVVDAKKETEQTTEVTALAKVYGPTECEHCRQFFQDVKNSITSNETESQLEQILRDAVCASLGPLQQECDKLLENYLGLFLALIADEVDPNVICLSIGFCLSDKEPLFKIPLRNVFANRPPVPLKYRSSEECEICKDLITDLDETIRYKPYQDKVKYEIENVVCSILGSYEAECKQLVEQYFPELLELLLNELDPTVVCETIGLCKVPGATPRVQPDLKVVPAQPVSDSLTCFICETVTQEVENLLKQNETVVTIEEMLEKVCKRLPDETLAQKCDSFVETYGDRFLKYLKQLKPEQVCSTLGLCTKKTEEGNKLKPLKDDAKCVFCKFVIGKLQEAMSNMTGEQILGALEKACSKLPGNFSAMCVSYVKKYAPFVIDLLKGSKPEVLCGMIKACGTADTGSPLFMTPIPEDGETKKETVSKPCEICNTVLMTLKIMLEQNVTKEEIEQLLEAICSKLPGFKGECEALIKQLIDMLLNEADPYTICKDIGLCKASKLRTFHPLMAGILSRFDTLPLQTTGKGKVKSVKGDTACDVCKMIVNDVDDTLALNSTQVTIVNALEMFCQNVMPNVLSTECVSLVDTYVPVVLNYIVLNLDSEVICKMVGLCATEKKTPKLVYVDLLKDTKAMSRKLEKQSGPQCALCEFVMEELDGLLKKNATEQEIVAALEKVCGKLPSTISKECDAFVEEYGPLVVDLLTKELDPSQICTKIGLCSEKALQSMTASVHLLPAQATKPEISRKLEAKSGPECVLCELVMSKLDNLIKENATEKEIVAALDKVCSLLPSSISKDCDAFIKTYGPAVIALLAQELDPSQICTQLGLCSGKALQSMVGPVQLIPDKASKPVSAGGEECLFCKYIVNLIKDKVDSNMTEEEIKKLLDDLCEILPDTVTAQCEDILDQYLPFILDLLKENINATEICMRLKFCISNDKILKPEKIDGALLSSKTENTLFFKPRGHLLGKDECTYGPSFWCANESNAKRCNAMEHCERYVWNRS